MLHKHHVIPLHAGGPDVPENIVLLTTEQHAEAHRILYEKHGRWQDRLAWQGLSGMISREEIIRQMLSNAGKNSRGNRGMKLPYRKLTEEHKAKISANNVGFRGMSHSSESIEKMRQSAKGKHSGNKNSQYGSRWITNGEVSKKISKSEELPFGWRPGRIIR